MAQLPVHHCRVLASPWPGVYGTEIRSGRHYGRHSHGTFGFGLEITAPVLSDPDLRNATLELMHALRQWQQGTVEALHCEEALVRSSAWD